MLTACLCFACGVVSENFLCLHPLLYYLALRRRFVLLQVITWLGEYEHGAQSFLRT